MSKTLRKNSSNNRIVIFLMILGLTTIFLSGCGQQPAEPAKNTASNTTTNSPDSAPTEGYTGETKKQELKNISLPFAEGEDLSVEVANDGTVIYERDMILGNISDFTKNSSPASAQLSGDTSAKKDTKPGIWANSTIPYVLPDNHGKKDVILAGIKEINEKTNICLVPRTTETDYVEFVSKDGSWARLGRVGGRQEISIDQTWTSLKAGTVAHEIMHTAGFVHMQSREDRDENVTINSDNIESGKESQFRKLKDKSSNIGAYDFTSVMHYSAKGFSKNGKNTIDVKAGGDASKMGQRDALSTGDIAAIAVKYTTAGACKSGGESKTTAAAGTCGEAPGDDEVYIYEHIFSQDKGGKCVKLGVGEYKDAAATGLADNIMSSIRVGKNVHTVVCDKENFDGACMAFDADDDNFTNNATLKNDIASSVKVVKAEICSATATVAMPIAWTNKTDKTLRINWVKSDCTEENNSREIKPGDVYNGSAGVGHIFHITNFQTGEKYGYIHVNKSTATQDIKDIK
ncbi:MAG: M12 family metallopeptidase [Acidobacteria bacterium]|nr:M12 family metallopeptidase [Acidobacteriota bacterium]